MVWAAFTSRFGRSQPRNRGATVYVYSHVGGGSSPSGIAQSFGLERLPLLSLKLLPLVLILNEHVPFLNSGLISKVPYVSKSGKEIWVVANKDWQTNAYTTGVHSSSLVRRGRRATMTVNFMFLTLLRNQGNKMSG